MDQEQLEISSQMSSLENAIELLNSKIIDLNKRLSPVLKDIPINGCDISEKEQSLCSLAGLIRLLRVKVDNIDSVVQSIFNRIQI